MIGDTCKSSCLEELMQFCYDGQGFSVHLCVASLGLGQRLGGVLYWAFHDLD